MNLFDALGPDVALRFASRRESVPRLLFVGTDAAARLAEGLVEEAAGRRLIVISDRRTRDAAGSACVNALSGAGFRLREHVLADRGVFGPICDDATHDSLLPALDGADAVVGVGSGVVSDLAKWVAWTAKLPAAIYATAASMNGYSSSNVAPAIRGVKSLLQARAHRIVAADPRVLRDAPGELTTAGLGDLIAKAVSTADWKLNHLLFGEDYSPELVDTVNRAAAHPLEDSRRMAEGDEATIRSLFEALVFSGCAMSLHGSSLPASGGEHLVSHAIDMRAETDGARHDLHGRQVGLATIFVAALYERILTAHAAPDIEPTPLPLDPAWGALRAAIAPHHERQQSRLVQACERIRQLGWSRVRDTIAPLVPAAREIERCLREAGGAHRLDQIGLDRSAFRWAVLNAAQIRERFTSIDLGWAAGSLPDCIEEIVDQYLSG